eukprot:Opistho-2@74470
MADKAYDRTTKGPFTTSSPQTLQETVDVLMSGSAPVHFSHQGRGDKIPQRDANLSLPSSIPQHQQPLSWLGYASGGICTCAHRSTAAFDAPRSAWDCPAVREQLGILLRAACGRMPEDPEELAQLR